jgi:hypothetical protein
MFAQYVAFKLSPVSRIDDFLVEPRATSISCLTNFFNLTGDIVFSSVIKY